MRALLALVILYWYYLHQNFIVWLVGLLAGLQKRKELLELSSIEEPDGRKC